MLNNLKRNAGPDFLGIGVARSGTTTAYKVLKNHPDVYMPDKKELHFFTFAQQSYQNQPAALKIMEEQYRGMFSEKGQRMAGEISPSYFYFPGAAKKIHLFNPWLKIFCILRNPVDRALSDFYYAGLDKKVSIDAFFSGGIQDLQHNKLVLKPFSASAILYKGFYRHHVENYLNQFSSDQLMLLPFSLLQKDIDQFFMTLFSFLDLGIEAAKLSVKENSAKYPTSSNDGAVRDMLEVFYRDEISFYSALEKEYGCHQE